MVDKPVVKPGSSLSDRLVATIPSLRAFAISLCGNRDRADDLVQETLVKAWDNLHSFQEGTSLKAWLFTILRNTYYSDWRKRRREVSDADGTYAESLEAKAAQPGYMELQDFRAALADLPDDQREALVLVGAAGFSYEEAAEICGAAVGTIKSRVSRARAHLVEILQEPPKSSEASGDSEDEDSQAMTISGRRRRPPKDAGQTK